MIRAVYARVSPAHQRTGLDRQVARVKGRATGQGITVGRVVTEVGFALNGKRRKLTVSGRPGQVLR